MSVRNDNASCLVNCGAFCRIFLALGLLIAVVYIFFFVCFLVSWNRVFLCEFDSLNEQNGKYLGGYSVKGDRIVTKSK